MYSMLRLLSCSSCILNPRRPCCQHVLRVTAALYSYSCQDNPATKNVKTDAAPLVVRSHRLLVHQGARHCAQPMGHTGPKADSLRAQDKCSSSLHLQQPPAHPCSITGGKRERHKSTGSAGSAKPHMRAQEVEQLAARHKRP